MKIADAVVEALRALDVRYVFGVSGANIEHLHDAVHRLGGDRLASVLAKSEAGAAFMADGYARAHRRLGVCCATSGGGMMNLAVGIAESYQESVPVLAIVGQPAVIGEGRGAFQDSSGIGRTVDARAVFGGMAKFVAKVTTADDFWETFERAVVAALGGRPGPAVLLVPRSSWSLDAGPMPADFADRVRAAVRPVPADPGAVRAILNDLRGASHPVLVVGQGVRRCSNPAAVIEFARAARIPVVTDLSARGEFPNDDPLYLGTLGVAGHPSAHHYLRDRADLLFAVGTGLNDLTRLPFAGDRIHTLAKRVIAVNVDLGELTRVVRAVAPHDPRVAVEADAGVVFEELLRLWREDPFQAPPVSGYRRQTFRPALAPKQPAARPRLAGTLLQSDALDALQTVLPRFRHVVYDAGNCAAAALHHLDLPAGASATIALGMGGMGYAIAAATGIALGPPRGRTLVLTGDGSLLMAGFEIHTAVEQRLPVLFVVFNNGMHGMCATRQQKFFDGRLECVSYSPVDVSAVARGLGDPDRLWVGRARSQEELDALLRDHAATADRPGVLELVLAREEVPPFVPLMPEGVETVERPPPGRRMTPRPRSECALPQLVGS